ncbi:NAD(P)/FAD-dependent oxidoreductase [Marinobacterium sp. YM272]|uniref:NAD(P)/FAD-dependent oxidoreductase n=1 Tax=Marinobacterium sp. YM272 TaxID=3421654 RepID=UPI003D7F5FB9
MRKQVDLLIIGNGMAANRLLQELCKQPNRPESILVIGEEPRPAYNRVLLSPFLAGELGASDVELNEIDWYAEQGIELLCGDPVLEVDPATRLVRAAGGKVVRYRRLVFATGSRSAMPEMPGIELDGVMGFRTWADVEQLQARAARGGRAVVVGGGLLGLEAAEGLRKLGMQTCVLQRGPWLLNRQLDRSAAGLLQATLEERGLKILTGAGIEMLQGDRGRVSQVMLKDGQMLDADLVVVAAGITPETALAREAGLSCHRAIAVDARMRTSDERVYALGECCEFQGQTYGLVAPIWRQAEVLAQVLSGQEHEYSEQPIATQLKVSGISLFSCGEIDAKDAQAIEYLDLAQREYRKLWLNEGRLIGAVLYGDTRLGPGYFDALLAQHNLSGQRESLLFGIENDRVA